MLARYFACTLQAVVDDMIDTAPPGQDPDGHDSDCFMEGIMTRDIADQCLLSIIRALCRGCIRLGFGCPGPRKVTKAAPGKYLPFGILAFSHATQVDLRRPARTRYRLFRRWVIDNLKAFPT